MARVAALAASVLVALAAYGYAEATRPPRIVRYALSAAAWTGLPITIALISDTHAVLPDMPPARLAAVCDRASALAPDLIVLAGDFMSQRIVRTYAVDVAAATAPFARCRAALGTFAVLGNHDVVAPGLGAQVAAGLRAAGVRVLRNDAVRADGVWVAGIDDRSARQPDFAAALARVPSGAPILFLMHNPDEFVNVPARVALTLAGHTHGGQIAPFGPIVLPIAHRTWARGMVRDHGAWMVVTSGVGTTGLPLRIGVPPEIALIRLQRAGRPPSAAVPLSP